MQDAQEGTGCWAYKVYNIRTFWGTHDAHRGACKIYLHGIYIGILGIYNTLYKATSGGPGVDGLWACVLIILIHMFT